MKKIITSAIITVAALVSIAWMAISCKTIASVDVPDPGIIAADCIRPGVHDVAIHWIDDVTSALVLTDFTGGLKAIVAKALVGVAANMVQRVTDDSWAAVKCAVEEVRAQANDHLAFGTFDSRTLSRESIVKDHAEAWLSSH